MNDAYVETTVLTDLLLKPNTPKQDRAQAAFKRYRRTLLPVYSIKEWKAGPLSTFAWIHNKLVTTGSFSDTINSVAMMGATYKKSTATEAVAAASVLLKNQRKQFAGLVSKDSEMADSYRLALVSLIRRSWSKRRKVTSQVVDELPCYVEVEPQVDKDGAFAMGSCLCDPEEECSLAPKLKARPDLLAAMRNAIPLTSTRTEDIRGRQALKKLIKHPNEKLDRETCRHLGDAIFAFFCPDDAVILTTNLKDHEPLARSIRKRAEHP